MSSGEDRRYRVWDAYGRQLYSSAVHDHPFTALAWNPQGDLFAAGAYDTVRVCDKTGVCLEVFFTPIVSGHEYAFSI